MNRRTALKALAVVPLVLRASPASAQAGLVKVEDYRLVTFDYVKEGGYPMRGALHIWHAESDFMIAYSAEHATELQREMIGGKGPWKDEWRNEGDGTAAEDWEQWPDDKPFPLTEELDKGSHISEHATSPSIDEAYEYEAKRVPMQRPIPTHLGKPRPDAKVVWHVQKDGRIWTKTTRKLPAEWIAEHGAGFFASTEF